MSLGQVILREVHTIKCLHIQWCQDSLVSVVSRLGAANKGTVAQFQADV